MVNFFKKTMFAGLGLAFLTKEKVVELCKELVAIEKLSEKEGEDLFNELTAKSEDARKEIKTHVEKVVQETVKKMNVVGKEGKGIIHDLSEKSEHAKEEFKTHIEKLVKDTIKKMNLVTRDDLKDLEKKIKPTRKSSSKSAASKRKPDKAS